MNPQVIEKLKSVEAQHAELLRLVSDAAVQADPPTYRTHAKALAELQPLVDRYREYQSAVSALADAKEMLASGDADIKSMADEEIAALEPKMAHLEQDIRQL